VVQQKILGGSLHFLAKFDFATERDKQSFSAAAGGSYSGFKLNTEMDSLRERFAGRAHITVKAIQTGGRKEQLAQVFAGASDGVAALDCDISNLDACRQFLVNATNYANGDFAQALRDGIWEDLNYITTDWADLGLRPDRALVPQEIIDARIALLEASKSQARVQSRIDVLHRTNYFGGPQSFRATVDQTESVLRANIDFIRRSTPACYDGLSSPPTGEEIAACAQLGSIVANPDSNPAFRGIDESQLQVPGRVSEVDGRTDFVTEVTPGAGLYGKWQETFTMCSEGKFAIGLSQRVEAQQGKGDDTALNSARLICQDYQTGERETKELFKGLYGDWHPETTCDSGPLSGIMIRLEASQGDGDDSGANDLKALA
jgi:Vitelline membrane outer layer protein I (VOMI)